MSGFKKEAFCLVEEIAAMSLGGEFEAQQQN